MATITVSGGGKVVSFGGAAFPPSMSGGCTGFRAWFVREAGEGGALALLRARWTDAGGAPHAADVAGVDWIDMAGYAGGDLDVPGDATFSLS